MTSAATTVQYPMTVFYDASCPLCLREMTLLKRYDQLDQIHLIDCSPGDFAAIEGNGRDAMMRVIHSRDAAGQWLVGAPVFAAAYRAAGFASVASLWAAHGCNRSGEWFIRGLLTTAIGCQNSGQRERWAGCFIGCTREQRRRHWRRQRVAMTGVVRMPKICR